MIHFNHILSLYIVYDLVVVSHMEYIYIYIYIYYIHVWVHKHTHIIYIYGIQLCNTRYGCGPSGVERRQTSLDGLPILEALLAMAGDAVPWTKSGEKWWENVGY